MEENQTRGQIKSVDKAIDILLVLAPEKAGMQLNEIARRLHINSSTAHHLLDTLKQRGFVDQHSQTGAYLVGYNLVGLAMTFLLQMDLVSASTDLVRELRDHTGETIYLNVLNNRQTFSLIEMAGTRPVQARRSRDTSPERSYLHATATGKLLLAYLPAEQSAAILASIPLAQFTPHTLTSVEALQQEMVAIRQQGYALDREEHIFGVACIDAPVFNYQGECVASVGVSYPATTLAERNNELLRAVLDTAAKISCNLGYVPGVTEGSSMMSAPTPTY